MFSFRQADAYSRRIVYLNKGIRRRCPCIPGETCQKPPSMRDGAPYYMDHIARAYPFQKYPLDIRSG